MNAGSVIPVNCQHYTTKVGPYASADQVRNIIEEIGCKVNANDFGNLEKS